MAIEHIGRTNSPSPQPSTTSPGNPFDKVKQQTAYDAYEAAFKKPDATNPYIGKGQPNNESAWNRGAEEARNYRAPKAFAEAFAAKARLDERRQFLAELVQDIQTPLPGSSTPADPNSGVGGPK